MAVFGRHVADTKYGLKIGWDNGGKTKKWYGSNRDLRDRKHNEFVVTEGVIFVQDIEEPK